MHLSIRPTAMREINANYRSTQYDFDRIKDDEPTSIASEISSPSRQSNGRSLSDFRSRSSRFRFMRKVMTIVLTQLSSTAAITYYLMKNTGVSHYLLTDGRPLLVLSFVTSFASVLALSLSQALRYNFPYNFIILGIFTLCQSLMMGVYSSQFAMKSVMLGSGHTIMALFAVILYSTQPNPAYDLTYMGNGLLALLSSVLVGSVANIYFGSTVADNLLLGFSTALFVAYMMRDVQLIVDRKKERHYGENDYIMASLSLYESIINLLYRMIEIANRMQQNGKSRNERSSQPLNEWG